MTADPRPPAEPLTAEEEAAIRRLVEITTEADTGWTRTLTTRLLATLDVARERHDQRLEEIDVLRAERDAARSQPDGLRAFIERQADVIHDHHSDRKTWRTCNFWMCSEARAALAAEGARDDRPPPLPPPNPSLISKGR